MGTFHLPQLASCNQKLSHAQRVFVLLGCFRVSVQALVRQKQLTVFLMLQRDGSMHLHHVGHFQEVELVGIAIKKWPTCIPRLLLLSSPSRLRAHKI